MAVATALSLVNRERKNCLKGNVELGIRRLGTLYILMLVSILLTSTLGCASKAEIPTSPVTPTWY